MLADPIHDNTIPIRASALKHLHVIAGFDRGCTLTKIAFIPKNTSLDDDEFVPMRCLTFLNANFEDALHVLKSQALLPTSGKLHCTGVGGDVYKDKIREITGLDTASVHERLTLGAGLYLTVINMKPENIFYPTPPYKNWNVAPEQLQVKDDAPLFPAFILYIGSGAGFLHVNEQGKHKFGFSGFFGKTFTGLANVLLGTIDYNEIMDLAAKGNRFKTCQTVGDVTGNQDLDTVGPMGRLPLDMPAFPFGKAAFKTYDRSSVSRADLAASLLAYYAQGVCAEMNSLSMTTKIKRFYIAGNFTRAEVVRSQILEANTRVPPHLDIRFIATGHTGAIGAMLLKENDSVADWTQEE